MPERRNSRNLSRPFGTRDLLASNPALKRWAILACPFGTAKPLEKGERSHKGDTNLL